MKKHVLATTIMSKKIPDFTDTQVWTVTDSLKERFRAEIDVQLIESEVRIHPHDRELTEVPGLYWQAEDCNFIILKTGQNRFRCQFFYRVHQQYGTGIDEYDDLTDCIVSLLQVQSDQARNSQQDQDGAG